MAISLGTSRGADFGQRSDTGITISDGGITDVATITIPRGATRLLFEVKNSHATVAFDLFHIARRAHASGAWQTIASIAGDYSSPAAPLLEVAGAPVTLAAGLSSVIGIDVEATDAVRLRASGNGATSTAEIYYRLQ